MKRHLILDDRLIVYHEFNKWDEEVYVSDNDDCKNKEEAKIA